MYTEQPMFHRHIATLVIVSILSSGLVMGQDKSGAETQSAPVLLGDAPNLTPEDNTPPSEIPQPVSGDSGLSDQQPPAGANLVTEQQPLAVPSSSVSVDVALERFVVTNADPASVQTLVDLGESGREAVTQWWNKRRRKGEAVEMALRFGVRCGAPCAVLFMDLLAANQLQDQVAQAIFDMVPSEGRQRLIREGVLRSKTETLRARFVAALAEDPGDSAHSLAVTASLSKNPTVRHAAWTALATIARSEDCGVLLKALGSERMVAGDTADEARRALVSALGVARCEQGVLALVQALGDTCCHKQAVSALVNIGEPAASALALVLKSGDKVRLGPAVEALLAIGALKGEDLAQAIATGSPELRAAARDLLIATRPDAVGETLAKNLRGARAKEALALLDIGVQLSPDQAHNVVRESLVHPDEQVRKAALERIGKAGLSYAVAELRLVATTDVSVEVRLAAVTTIHRMAELSCLDVLVAAANREDERIRIAAVDALADLGNRVQVPELIPLLQENSRPVQQAAYHTLTRLVGVTLPVASGEWRNYWQQAAKPWFTDPFVTARRQSLTGDDGRVTQWVEAGSGTPIVVLGGNPDGGSDYLRPIVAHLTNDYRVVLVDLPGRNNPGNFGAEVGYSPERDLMDLEAVRNTLGIDRVFVVGHAFGAVVAAMYAHTYPQVVQSVVLLNESITPLTNDVTSMRKIAAVLPEPWKSDYERFMVSSHEYSSFGKRRIQWVLLLRGTVQDATVYRWLMDSVSPSGVIGERIMAAWAHIDVEAVVMALSVPTLVITGVNVDSVVISPDKLTPSREESGLQTTHLDAGDGLMVSKTGSQAIAKRLAAFFTR